MPKIYWSIDSVAVSGRKTTDTEKYTDTEEYTDTEKLTDTDSYTDTEKFYRYRKNLPIYRIGVGCLLYTSDAADE